MHKCRVDDPGACINADGSLCDYWERAIGTPKDSRLRVQVAGERRRLREPILWDEYPQGPDWFKDHWGGLDHLNGYGGSDIEWDDPTADAALG